MSGRPEAGAAEGRAAGVAAVVIGRNEGARLAACLRSIPEGVAPVVYVDSGSTDDSVELAAAAGAQVVALGAERPFTAARARNAGVAALAGPGPGPVPGPEFVQFVDGDCTLAPGWVAAALAAMAAQPRAAVVFGRLRERAPEASVYNRLCDLEWAGGWEGGRVEGAGAGPVAASGGIALMRAGALRAVGGFDPALIAGEEPDLCARLRAAGWEVWRIEAEMALHDADMTRFAQWWRRSRRSGHAAAEGWWRHRGAAEAAQQRRALVWGGALPLALLGGAVASPWAWLLLLAWPAQVVRLALRAGPGRRLAWEWAGFATLGKLPEAMGVAEFHARRLLGRPAGLIGDKPAPKDGRRSGP